MTTNDRPDQYREATHIDPSRDVVQPRPRRTQRTFSGGEMPMEEITCIGFDVHGQCVAEEAGWVAKRTHSERGVRCYVLHSTTGYDVGHMLNPYGLYFDANEVSRVSSQRGRPRYEFKRVAETSFDDYLRFLRSRLESYLRNAERASFDG